jgi:hypothetical protein
MRYITGDIHGDAEELWHRISDSGMLSGKHIGSFMHDGIPHADMTDKTVPICVIAGDVGILYGTGKQQRYASDLHHLMYTRFKKILFIVVRGNHDTRYWRDFMANDNPYDGFAFTMPDRFGARFMYQKRHPNILYANDSGDLYDIGGKPTLVIPGAYSIDMQYRIRNGYPYEYAEQLLPDEIDRLTDIAKSVTDEHIDVVSHTCPHSWYPSISSTFASGIDESTVDSTMEIWLDTIWDEVRDKCDAWYFGHFHADMDVQDTDGKGRMLFHEIDTMR